MLKVNFVVTPGPTIRFVYCIIQIISPEQIQYPNHGATIKSFTNSNLINI